MHKMVQNLEERLQSLRRKEAQRRLLRNIYDQLVPSRKSGQQKQGEYRNLIQTGSESPLEFVAYLEGKLREFAAKDHLGKVIETDPMIARARRLHEYYLSGLYVPKK